MFALDQDIKGALKRTVSGNEMSSIVESYCDWSGGVESGSQFHATVIDNDKRYLCSVFRSNGAAYVFKTHLNPHANNDSTTSLPSYSASVEFQRISPPKVDTGLGVAYKHRNLSEDGIKSMHATGVERTMRYLFEPENAESSVWDVIKDSFKPNDASDTVEGIKL